MAIPEALKESDAADGRALLVGPDMGSTPNTERSRSGARSERQGYLQVTVPVRADRVGAVQGVGFPRLLLLERLEKNVECSGQILPDECHVNVLQQMN